MNRSMISDYLSRWEVMHEAGRTISPEQLPLEFPELANDPMMLEALRQRIRARQEVAPPLDLKAHGLHSTLAPVTNDALGGTSSAADSPPQVPGYEIVGELGRGGMGVVYRACQIRLGREVALKLLRGDFAQDPDWMGRFEREARLLAALNHGNIAAIYGLDEVQSIRYLVMELVPGQTLADRLAEGRLPLDEALGYCRQVADGLEAAHERGIIHRDLKPGNVMITPEGKVKLLDFGLAKSTTPAVRTPERTAAYEHHSVEGAVVGTAAYMAPEQARGKVLDKRCDIWAFGCVMFEAITGRRPFTGETYTDILAAVIQQSPDWQALPRGLPARVGVLLRRCLQKDAHQRLRDVGDARLEIDEALAELAAPLPAAPVQPPSSRRMRWWLLAAAGVLIAFTVGMAAQRLRDGRVSLPPSPTDSPPPLPHWSGQFLLGGATRAFGPRLSPDGQWLAFLVLKDGQTQVGVMKLGSGEWRVLTNDRSRGGLLSVSWSADSNRIFFDRFCDVPGGVYSVSPLDPEPKGARETPLVDKAECPQMANDGSLIVCKLDDQGHFRLHRHWLSGPLRGQLGEVVSPPLEFDLGWPSPMRTLRKKNQVVFFGRILDGKEGPSRWGVYLLDLDKQGQPVCLCSEDVVPEPVPLAVSPDDRFVYTVFLAGDLFRVVRIPIEERSPPQTLLTLPSLVYGLDVDLDGRLYLDHFQRSMEVLRFQVEGGPAERITPPSLRRGLGPVGLPVELPDDRVLLPSQVAGRFRLLAARAGKDPQLLLEDNQDETAPPVVLLDNRRLAFVVGSKKERQVKLADLEGEQVRIGQTLKDVPGEGLTGMTSSPDGKTIYYVHSNHIWQVPSDNSRTPEKVLPGDGVAVHPTTGELFIQRFEKTGVRLFRTPQPGGAQEEIKVPQERFRLAPHPLGGRAINKDGQILAAVTSMESWFWRMALLDPGRGTLKLIPVDFDGEIYPANWDKEGKILGMGYPYKAELWRISPSE